MAQKTTSKMAAKYGAKFNQAVSKHAEDETDYGSQRLPGGIPNGIAKLTKCYFKEYDAATNQKQANGVSAKGEYYFRAEGVVVEPSHNDKGIPVKGLPTSIMIPVCDTKKSDGTTVTQEEHVEEILNELRKLGGEEYTRGASGADMESLAEGLVLAKPYFKFATSESKPQIDPTTKLPKVNPRTGEPYPPRIWENWYGAKGLESYSAPDETSAAVEDHSGDAQEAPEAQTEPEPEETTPDASNDAVDAGEDVSDVEVLVGLAETADLEDESDECEEAQKELKKIAEEAGIAPKKVKGASNWAEVVEMIQEAKAESEAVGEDPPTDEDTAEDDKYAVGKTFKYAPIVKTKDKAGKITTVKKKPLDVEIMEVDAEKETCVCKNLVDDKTPYKGVKFSDLIED